MKVGFDGGIRLEFYGAKLSSNGGLLAYRYHHECKTGRSCTFLQWPRNGRAVDQRRQICAELNPALMQTLRLEPGTVRFIRSGIQSGKFP